jgi:hypothetical protein
MKPLLKVVNMKFDTKSQRSAIISVIMVNVSNRQCYHGYGQQSAVLPWLMSAIISVTMVNVSNHQCYHGYCQQSSVLPWLLSANISVRGRVQSSWPSHDGTTICHDGRYARRDAVGGPCHNKPRWSSLHWHNATMTHCHT